MISYAEFAIEGRVGKITAEPNRTRVDIATTYARRDAANEYYDEVSWWIIFVFGEERFKADKLLKGDHVRVTGRMRATTYDKDGVKHYRTELIGGHLQLGLRPPAKRLSANA